MSAEPERLATRLWRYRQTAIALATVVLIAVHLILRYGTGASESIRDLPLWIVLIGGGGPLVLELAGRALKREFGSDLLAGISIVTAILLGEYLAGALVVLMLSGGEALEAYAVRNASAVLLALSRRMPSAAHRRTDSTLEDVPLDAVRVGDVLAVFPHEICPVDGVVLEGRGTMDESYLTGEPYLMSKTPGSEVLSGAVNGETSLTIRAEKLAVDSRYARIMKVMQESEQQRPRIRRLGDQLGAFYTPLAVAIAVIAWMASGEALRFLAVLVVATPCPLLIAIPVSIIGSISLAASRAIIIRDPSALETADRCRTLIFDKTGTLTYGRPTLTDVVCGPEFDAAEVLSLVGSLERYSKHPLSGAIIEAADARRAVVHDVEEISERPGEGLRGRVAGRRVQVTSRKQLSHSDPQAAAALPPLAGGLECVIVIDGRYAATLRFRDAPRPDGRLFIGHLPERHGIRRTLLVSGDRASEVQYLAEQVGIENVFFDQSPEQKLDIVREETEQARTIFVGDGINDAPALMAATIGIAFGQNSDVTTEAADVVVLDSSLRKVDEFLHISRRMRRIALQSAVGGMTVSVLAMFVAAAGYLPPVAGAITQEVIDVVAVLNALRVSIRPRSLTDF
ncbi:MAG: heavy metal translocating P-type ATPase [Planctomyces sp.]|nr:heavy metal translocating P-type ATPase [Planctomyces sp.]